MSKLIFGAAGIIAVIAYWFFGGINKTVDYFSQRTNIQVQQTSDTVLHRSQEISSGRTINDPAYLARKAAREEEQAKTDRVLSKDRAKADTHVDKAEKHADELETQGESQPKKIDPLDAFARSK